MNYFPLWVIFLLALIIALGSFGVVAAVDASRFLEWFIELTATAVAALLAAAGGVWLFHYGEQERTGKLEEKLLTRLAVESKLNLERLGSPGTPVANQKTGEVLQTIALVELSTVALRDFIRSDVFDPEDVLVGLQLEGLINAHNNDVATLLGWRGGTPVARTSMEHLLNDLNKRQHTLADAFKETLQNLQERGIEPPPESAS